MKHFKKLVSWLLTAALAVGLLGAVPGMAADVHKAPVLADLGGFISADQKDAQIGWTNDAMNQDQMRALVDAQELHPQLTGYAEMDSAIDDILANAPAGADTYDKLQTIYTWIIQNVVYTHNGYGYVEGATNTYDYFQRDFYTGNMTVTEGIQHFIPDKVINHAAYALFEKRGACYDFGSLMAVAIRHVGINAYVHTGYWILESNGSTDNHHGWTEIELDGALYIIDPQREARYTEAVGYNCNIYFGIPHTDGWDWRYWCPDSTDNNERDALFTSVTVDQGTGVTQPGGSPVDPGDPVPEETLTLQVMVTGNGSVTCDAQAIGENTYQVKTGDKVHFEAVPGSNSAFSGWWDFFKKSYLEANNPDFLTAAQLSADEGLTVYIDPNELTVNEGNLIIQAQFLDTGTLNVVSSRSGSVKSDGAEVIGAQEHLLGSQVNLSAEPANKLVGWYNAQGVGLSAEETYSFQLDGNTTIYALFAGDVFCDLKSTDWYLDDAMEANRRGLVNGLTPVTFGGNKQFTRAMAATMIARLAKADDVAAAPAPFTDVDQGAWYAPSVNWAYENGVIKGRSQQHFDPNGTITREEFFAMVVRYLGKAGGSVETSELPYTDADQITFAWDELGQAQTMGLVKGDNTGTLRPTAKLKRSEGTAIILRAARYLEKQ